jgi:hypothetical protein
MGKIVQTLEYIFLQNQRNIELRFKSFTGMIFSKNAKQLYFLFNISYELLIRNEDVSYFHQKNALKRNKFDCSTLKHFNKFCN